MARLYFPSEGGGCGGCSGSIIKPTWIITAAHCFKELPKPITNITIYVGDVDVNKKEPCEKKLVSKAVHQHEKFNPETLDNDIALVELDLTLQFNRHIDKINLPKPGKGYEYYEKATLHLNEYYICGYGKTYSSENVPLCAKHLQSADNMKFSAKYTCNRNYEKINRFVSNKSFCAIGDESTTDVCDGDSGGPFFLVPLEAPKNWTLLGITSFGEGCGEGYPSVYSDVEKYYPWINKLLSDED